MECESPAEYAVSLLPPGHYDEGAPCPPALLFCSDCFGASGGPHAFSDGGWRGLGQWRPMWVMSRG